MYRKTGQKKFCKVGRELGGILEISDTRWKAKSPQPCGYEGFGIERKSANTKQYAEFLGVNVKTVQNKLNGETDFTYKEFRKTCTMMFPEYNTEYLFANEQPQKTA